MANRYKQITNDGSESHFSAAVSGELASSRMVSTPEHITAFNAGDIVPIYCLEVLPHDTIGIDMDFVVRQTTLLTPTMGSMDIDIYAFFVPNRVVNRSWKTVMGENPNGSWTASSVSLAPLVDPSVGAIEDVSINVGSVADYYGFPTQSSIPASVLSSCHDLKFRGYVEIYNEFFRDQNYQPPIPYSKLNVYNDFLHTLGSRSYTLTSPNSGTLQDNSYGSGSTTQAVFGNLTAAGAMTATVIAGSVFNANGLPLKANKFHDYFTSVLPSPQKGPQVLLPIGDSAPVRTASSPLVTNGGYSVTWRTLAGSSPASGIGFVFGSNGTSTAGGTTGQSTGNPIYPSNLYADLSSATEVSLSDLRMAAAVQQVYEQLARSGSRYREFVRGFFGLEVDDPYKDIPTYLGHIRCGLELYQTAQTSASSGGSTAQGNLAGFGYTATSGELFKPVTFLEHGYIHVLAVVRHKNIYSSFLARDNFRMNMLDWYMPQLANVSEQPVYLREINPFVANASSAVIGYQEAWAEYRYDPDYVTGFMRPGVSDSLSLWTYADDYAPSFDVVTGAWLQSNSQAVLDRTLAVTSSVAPQLKGQFRFKIDKERPLPTYSIPGLDIF